MTGVIVTSSSCSGTCRTFSIPRQPNVIADEKRPGGVGFGAEETALRTAAVSAAVAGAAEGESGIVGLWALMPAVPPCRAARIRSGPRRRGR